MRFEKVTEKEAMEATEKAVGTFDRKALKKALEGLQTPHRATSNSAGYDFYCPYDVLIRKGESKAIPLLIKVKEMPSDVCLLILNRSGLSLKSGLRLDNAVGLIDADYDQCIWYQATAQTKDVVIMQGDRICQGTFVRYLTVDGDEAKGKRNGGFGSTGK